METVWLEPELAGAHYVTHYATRRQSSTIMETVWLAPELAGAHYVNQRSLNKIIQFEQKKYI